MRYKQDLAKFLLIADAARLIQERAGISEDEAREDIVRAVQDYSVRVLLSDVRKDGRHLRKGSDDHIVRELSPERIDWETSIAERRSLYASFTVEIEVSRSSLDWLWPAPDGDEERGATQSEPKSKQGEQTTIAAERRCREWLLPLMKAGSPTKPKADYLADATKKYGVGTKAFIRAWGYATSESGNQEWIKPGRKS